MEDAQRGQGDVEFWLSGLVMKDIHTEGGSQTAADGSGEQKGPFGNAPFSFFGFLLVHTHKQERRCIDYNDVVPKVLHRKHPFGGSCVKKLLVFVGMLGLLTGCGATPTWEYVQDRVMPEEVVCWQEEAYTISLGLPQDCALLKEELGRSVYGKDDLEVEKRMFLTSGKENAIKTVSGLDASQLTVMETTRFGMPEYQFAWYQEQEQGGRLCRADLIIHDQECYAVICSSAVEAGDSHADEIRQVFSSFGLYTAEGV